MLLFAARAENPPLAYEDATDLLWMKSPRLVLLLVQVSLGLLCAYVSITVHVDLHYNRRSSHLLGNISTMTSHINPVIISDGFFRQCSEHFNWGLCPV